VASDRENSVPMPACATKRTPLRRMERTEANSASAFWYIRRTLNGRPCVSLFVKGLYFEIRMIFFSSAPDRTYLDRPRCFLFIKK
jgi:hypothetical protein